MLAVKYSHFRISEDTYFFFSIFKTLDSSLASKQQWKHGDWSIDTWLSKSNFQISETDLLLLSPQMCFWELENDDWPRVLRSRTWLLLRPEDLFKIEPGWMAGWSLGGWKSNGTEWNGRALWNQSDLTPNTDSTISWQGHLAQVPYVRWTHFLPYKMGVMLQLSYQAAAKMRSFGSC